MLRREVYKVWVPEKQARNLDRQRNRNETLSLDKVEITQSCTVGFRVPLAADHYLDLKLTGALQKVSHTFVSNYFAFVDIILFRGRLSTTVCAVHLVCVVSGVWMRCIRICG